MNLEKYYMKKQATEWIKFAKTDLQATMAIINEDNLSTIAAFHTQQCIEKSLKALLSLIKISSYRSVLSDHFRFSLRLQQNPLIISYLQLFAHPKNKCHLFKEGVFL